MNARNTLNSQSVAYDALSLVPGSEGNSSQPAVSLPPNSSVAQAASSDSLCFFPASPSFLAAVANAVLQVLSAQQASRFLVRQQAWPFLEVFLLRQHTQASWLLKRHRSLHLALVSQLLHRPW